MIPFDDAASVSTVIAAKTTTSARNGSSASGMFSSQPHLPLTAATLRSHSQQQLRHLSSADSPPHLSLISGNFSHLPNASVPVVASSPGSSLRSSVRTSLRSSSLPRHLVGGAGGGSVTDVGATLTGSGTCASHGRPRPRSASSGGSGDRRGSREDDNVPDEGNYEEAGGLSFRSIISSASFASLPRGEKKTTVGERRTDPLSLVSSGEGKDKAESSNNSSLNSVHGSANGSKGFGLVRDLYYLKQVRCLHSAMMSKVNQNSFKEITSGIMIFFPFLFFCKTKKNKCSFQIAKSVFFLCPRWGGFFCPCNVSAIFFLKRT